jgi:hypothetical protein
MGQIKNIKDTVRTASLYFKWGIIQKLPDYQIMIARKWFYNSLQLPL